MVDIKISINAVWSCINNVFPKPAPSTANNNFIVLGGESSEQRNIMTAEFFNKEKFEYFTLDSIRSLYIPAIPLWKPSMVELQNKDILICGGIYEGNIQDDCYILKKGE